MPWQDPDLNGDEDDLIERILASMMDSIDGWEPNEGAPEVALAEAIGHETAATNALAVQALQVAVAGMGETVFGVAARVATAATLPDVALELSITRTGAAGADSVDQPVTIPAGFTILANGVAYSTSADLVQTVTFAKAGSDDTTTTYTATVHTPMTAQLAGLAGNVTAGTATQIVTASGIVTTATIAADGTGGADDEALVDYLTRLTDYVATLRPGGVRADDLARLARGVEGVERALVIDLYDPANPDTPAELTVTVIAVDDTGQPVAGTVATELQSTLEATREVNFVIHLADPTYTAIAIDLEVTASAGIDHAGLQASLVDVLTAAIDPATWGTTPGDPTSWTDKTTLRVLDVAALIGQVPGIASITTLTLNGGDQVDLDGPGALPAPLTAETPSTITVTVA